MATIRLTNHIRNKIVENLTKEFKAKEKKAAFTARKKAALDLLKHALGPENWRRYRRLPEGWLRCQSYFYITTSSGQYRRVNLYDRLPIPAFIQDNYGYSSDGEYSPNKNLPVVDMGDAPFVAWEAAEKTYEDIETKIKTMRLDTEAVLFSCTTVAALIKTWPEIEAVVRECVSGVVTANLPARINLKALNEDLGL